jgi:S-adenosylmethionine synthetase
LWNIFTTKTTTKYSASCTLTSIFIFPNRKRSVILANNTYAVDFLALLSDDELALTIENTLPNNHRERIYTPTKTLSMFLAQTINEDRSCSKTVNDMLIQAQFVNNTSANTAAYCKARKR